MAKIKGDHFVVTGVMDFPAIYRRIVTHRSLSGADWSQKQQRPRDGAFEIYSPYYEHLDYGTLTIRKFASTAS